MEVAPPHRNLKSHLPLPYYTTPLPPSSSTDHLHHPQPQPQQQQQSTYVSVPLYYFHAPRNDKANFRIVSAYSLLLFAVFTFFLWPSEPGMDIARLNLEHVRIRTVPRVAIDISLAFQVQIHNANFYSMDYDSLRLVFGYRGTELGGVSSNRGHVIARGSSHVHAVLKFDGLEVLHDVVHLIKDLRKGTVAFDTAIDVHGKLGLFYFVFPLKAKVSCLIYVNTVNQTIIRQNCYRKVSDR